jgi:hypothetical protein
MADFLEKHRKLSRKLKKMKGGVLSKKELLALPEPDADKNPGLHMRWLQTHQDAERDARKNAARHRDVVNQLARNNLQREAQRVRRAAAVGEVPLGARRLLERRAVKDFNSLEESLQRRYDAVKRNLLSAENLPEYEQLLDDTKEGYERFLANPNLPEESKSRIRESYHTFFSRITRDWNNPILSVESVGFGKPMRKGTPMRKKGGSGKRGVQAARAAAAVVPVEELLRRLAANQSELKAAPGGARATAAQDARRAALMREADGLRQAIEAQGVRAPAEGEAVRAPAATLEELRALLRTELAEAQRLSEVKAKGAVTQLKLAAAEQEIHKLRGLISEKEEAVRPTHLAPVRAPKAALPDVFRKGTPARGTLAPLRAPSASPKSPSASPKSPLQMTTTERREYDALMRKAEAARTAEERAIRVGELQKHVDKLERRQAAFIKEAEKFRIPTQSEEDIARGEEYYTPDLFWTYEDERNELGVPGGTEARRENQLVYPRAHVYPRVTKEWRDKNFKLRREHDKPYYQQPGVDTDWGMLNLSIGAVLGEVPRGLKPNQVVEERVRRWNAIGLNDSPFIADEIKALFAVGDIDSALPLLRDTQRGIQQYLPRGEDELLFQGHPGGAGKPSKKFLAKMMKMYKGGMMPRRGPAPAAAPVPLRGALVTMAQRISELNPISAVALANILQNDFLNTLSGPQKEAVNRVINGTVGTDIGLARLLTRDVRGHANQIEGIPRAFQLANILLNQEGLPPLVIPPPLAPAPAPPPPPPPAAGLADALAHAPFVPEWLRGDVMAEGYELAQEGDYVDDYRNGYNNGF